MVCFDGLVVSTANDDDLGSCSLERLLWDVREVLDVRLAELNG
jgi:hypothetical protein